MLGIFDNRHCENKNYLFNFIYLMLLCLIFVFLKHDLIQTMISSQNHYVTNPSLTLLIFLAPLLNALIPST